jgi:predicted acylesterase/phospholipase RssA
MAGQGEAHTGTGSTSPISRDMLGLATVGPTKGSNGKVFELGLVMAGAISAGAYTAGVIDFLIEALDEFEKMKADPAYDGPRHSVMIPVMTGASAGGMTASIATLQLFHEIEHVRPGAAPPAPKMNRLYSSWVSDIDLVHLLDQSDLQDLDDRVSGDPEAVIKSVLCCDVLDRIVDKAFGLGERRDRSWIGGRFGEPLRLCVTVSNVTGVPYDLKMIGAAPGADFYGMLDHGDRVSFSVGGAAAVSVPVLDFATMPKPVGGTGRIDWAATHEPVWDAFRRSALATGAFPIGLAPRVVWRGYLDYMNNAKYHVTDPGGARVAVHPAFHGATGDYRFPSVDGGTIDNEPLETARQYLADKNPARVTVDGVARNPRNGCEADTAVVLVDPFPNVVKVPPSDENGETRFGLVATMKSLLGMLIDQARFKPEELQLSHDDKVFSRFEISPARSSKNADARKLPIASGALGGFSGFISESYRRHDYLLGRRNAQAFLRWHLVLPKSNPIFGDAGAIGAGWTVKDPPPGRGTVTEEMLRAAPPMKVASQVDGPEDEEAFPIIPLSKRLCDPIVIGPEDRPWIASPRGIATERADFFESRVNRIVRRLLGTELAEYVPTGLLSGLVRRFAPDFVAKIARKRFETAVYEAIKDVETAFAVPPPRPSWAEPAVPPPKGEAGRNS